MDEAQKQKQKDALLKAVKDAVNDTAVADLIETKVNAAVEKLAGTVTDKAGELIAGEAVELKAGPQMKDHVLGKFILAAAAGSRAAKEEGGISNEKVRKHATTYAEKQFGKGHAVTKGLASAEFAESGLMITGDGTDEFIDLLVPSVAVLSLNPVTVPMPSGTYTAPSVTDDVSGYYRGEQQRSTQSKPTTGSLSLRSKELVVSVPISNKLLRRSNNKAAAFVERLASRRVGLRKDQALLMGNGTVHTPKGLYRWAGETKDATSATPTFAQVLADLGWMFKTLEDGNVSMSNPGIIMRPRVKNFMMFELLTDNGVPYFLEMLKAGMLLGVPYRDTNNVPGNLGAGADESFILCADFDHVLYGEEQGLTVKVSTEATYWENGNIKSAFDEDVTLMQLTEMHDLTVEHTEAVVRLDGVKWGN